MMTGHQSWLFSAKPVILGRAAVVGPEEGKGPLAADFDEIYESLTLEQKSWEQAERKLMEEAAKLAIKKAGITKEQVNFYVGGDLMNQIISTTFAARTFGVPYLGVFGACSTAMESLAVASLIVQTGGGKYVLCGTCSHNCTAEKQFRYPTEYGSQKPPTAQYTVTGAGASIVAAAGDGPVVTRATIGRIVDMGIKDPYNMGAAMAPAAADTIAAHFRDFRLEPGYYDMIVTGDLASVGHELVKDLLKEKEVPYAQTDFTDCGLMIYDRKKQQVQAGGSGCGCSASVTYGHLLNRLEKGEVKRILVVATGALLSQISAQQGETIPCIAHAVAIERKEAAGI
ncbi:stage V sporulation protein AD [Gorillibacterium massiliense]|uniref:stage V sporulation protein AD n=1 Tax=Gorillibacterium massiliense TaxID=1280390 RepID=UPI0004AEB553|nr:stage V sporulation protein AD [Gorillibacterium massiliense]